MKNLSTSLEDYLEAAYTLGLKDGFSRACGISRLLKVSKPSVNAAVKGLAARGLLKYERYGYIRLTAAGLKAGAEISGRHLLLKDFFISVLAMDDGEAERDACRAEHALSPGALKRVGALAIFLKEPKRRRVLLAARSAMTGRKTL